MEQPSPEIIFGAVLEARDLAATRDFYQAIFRDARGTWSRESESLLFRTDRQRIEFVERSRPRALAKFGQHWGFRVQASRWSELLKELTQRGSEVQWWREDHPAEREPTAYVLDPSGNQIQLIASQDPALLLDHVGIVVHDLELAELFYLEALGGALDYYYGWRTEDRLGARAWGEGRDPCAPWTRRADVSYRSRARIPLPNPQLFIRLGASRLALILALKHIQEPAEEIIAGTPRLILKSAAPADEWDAYLAGVRIAAVTLRHDGHRVRFERRESAVFLRDPGGNFVQLECAGSKP